MRDSIAASWACRTRELRVLTEDVGGAFGLKTGDLSGISGAAGRRASHRPAGALDVEPLRSPSSATIRRATPPRKPSSRSTARAASWRCASATSPVWAPISARSAPTSRRQFHPLLPRHVRHQASRRERVRVHQHDADRALSRRRPAGGELRLERVIEEAARLTGIDPSSCAGATSSRLGDAVQDRDRHHL